MKLENYNTDLQKQNNSKKWIYVGTGLTMVLLIVYGWFLTVSVISDETITMGNDASLMGNDWTLMVGAVGGFYYRYFQALMALPLFQIFNTPETVYRMTMVLQGIVQATIVPAVYVICRKYLKIPSAKICTLLGMAVCLSSSMVINTFYFRGDYLLGVLPWFALWLFLETMDAAKMNQTGKRILCTLLVTACSVVAYMSHTRGIVLGIAVLMTAVFVRIIMKQKNLHWISLIGTAAILLVIDYYLTGHLRNMLYSISGVAANSFDSVSANSYFNLFSYDMLKSIIMLSISWLQTLIASTAGLMAIGLTAMVMVLSTILNKKKRQATENEYIIFLFGFLVFCGYFAVGALFFKGAYIELATGVLTRRSDRLLYDRYAICGASFVIFAALYTLVCHRAWWKRCFSWICVIGSAGLLGFSIWKFFPLAAKYKGYVYNTVILTTFQKIDKVSGILSGMKYSKRALVFIGVLAIVCMVVMLLLSNLKRNTACCLLIFVILAELGLTQVNYVKIRKASNDYIAEATQAPVDFLAPLESELTEEYPYILKGGLPGIKIQFYQGRLMKYRFFGMNMLEELAPTDYFLVTTPEGIEKWREKEPTEPYYLLEDWDYENASYDSVYVVGEKLCKRLTELGYIVHEP